MVRHYCNLPGQRHFPSQIMLIAFDSITVTAHKSSYIPQTIVRKKKTEFIALHNKKNSKKRVFLTPTRYVRMAPSLSLSRVAFLCPLPTTYTARKSEWEQRLDWALFCFYFFRLPSNYNMARNRSRALIN